MMKMFEKIKAKMNATKVFAKIIVKENEHLREIASIKASLFTEYNTFHYGKKSYVIDLTKTAYYSKDNSPVLFYELNNSIPLSVSTLENVNLSGKKPSSGIFDEMFRRQKLKAILQSASRAKQETPFWVYLALGLVIGILIGIVVEPYLLNSLVH